MSLVLPPWFRKNQLKHWIKVDTLFGYLFYSVCKLNGSSTFHQLNKSLTLPIRIRQKELGMIWYVIYSITSQNISWWTVLRKKLQNWSQTTEKIVWIISKVPCNLDLLWIHLILVMKLLELHHQFISSEWSMFFYWNESHK